MNQYPDQEINSSYLYIFKNKWEYFSIVRIEPGFWELILRENDHAIKISKINTGFISEQKLNTSEWRKIESWDSSVD